MAAQPTVFVVDDDLAVRQSVCALVKPMGVSTESFTSAEEFLDAYDRSRPGCLVTDLRMLGMSGLELQDKLAGMGITLPVIIVTAYADVPVAVCAMEKGAITLLEKPCRESDLWDAIRKALALDAERRQERARCRETQKRISQLTPDERQVMNLMIAGKPNKVIASELNLGVRTVELRRHHVFNKMHTESLAELVQLVVEARAGEESR